jgi:hypothetical protein
MLSAFLLSGVAVFKIFQHHSSFFSEPFITFQDDQGAGSTAPILKRKIVTDLQASSSRPSAGQTFLGAPHLADAICLVQWRPLRRRPDGAKRLAHNEDSVQFMTIQHLPLTA